MARNFTRRRRAALTAIAVSVTASACSASQPDTVRLDTWPAATTTTTVAPTTTTTVAPTTTTTVAPTTTTTVPPDDATFAPIDGDPHGALVERGAGDERPRILLLGNSYVGSFADAIERAAYGYEIDFVSGTVSGVGDFGDRLLYDWRSDIPQLIARWQPDGIVISAAFYVDTEKQCLRSYRDEPSWRTCYAAAVERDAATEWGALAQLLAESSIPTLWIGPSAIRHFGPWTYGPHISTQEAARIFTLDVYADRIEEQMLFDTLTQHPSIEYLSSRAVLGESIQAFTQAADGTWWQQRTLDGRMHLCPYGAIQLTRAAMPLIVEAWDKPVGSTWETASWVGGPQYVSAPCSFRPYATPRATVAPGDITSGGGYRAPTGPGPEETWPVLCQRLDAATVAALFNHGPVRWLFADTSRVRMWNDPVALAGTPIPPDDSCAIGIGIDNRDDGLALAETYITIGVYAVGRDALIAAYQTAYRIESGADDDIDLMYWAYEDSRTTVDVAAGVIFEHDGDTWMVRGEVPPDVAWAQSPLSMDVRAQPFDLPVGGNAIVFDGFRAIAARVTARSSP